MMGITTLLSSLKANNVIGSADYFYECVINAFALEQTLQLTYFWNRSSGECNGQMTVGYTSIHYREDKILILFLPKISPFLHNIIR